MFIIIGSVIYGYREKTNTQKVEERGIDGRVGGIKREIGNIKGLMLYRLL
jgi:hypothetical protein